MELIVSRYLKSIEAKVLELIGEAKRQGRRMTVIVPSQASFLMEKKIIESFGGFCDIEVMSFEKLTHSILTRAGGCALPRTDSIGTGIRIRRILEEKTEELRLFSVKNDEELHMRLASSLSSMSAEGITPDELFELSQAAEGQLAHKLHDMSVIYKALLESVGDELTPDAAERYAADMIPDCSFLKESKIVIHGFELLTQNKLYTITSLLSAGCDVTMTLEADEEDDVFYHQNMLMVKIKDAARIAGRSVDVTLLKDNVRDIGEDIAFLEDALYSFPVNHREGTPENIEIVCLSDPREEAEFITSRILRENSSGMRLRDIGILSSTAAPERLREALDLCGISYSSDGKRKLIRHRLCDFVISAVKVLYNGRWNMEDMREYLKTKMLLDTAQTDALLKYAEEKGMKGFRFKSAFEDEEIEALRKTAMEPLMLLSKEGDAAEVCCSLRDFILNSSIPFTLEAEALMLERYGKHSEARFTSQVTRRVCEILSQTASCAAGMDKKLLYPLLLCGFGSAELSIVPPATDEIVLGEITHSIFPRKKLMVICGANDGSLPAPPPSGLFTTDELELLNEKRFFPGLSLPEDQRIYIRRALTSADKLLITYNERDGLPSSVIERIKRIFPDMPTGRGEETCPCSLPAVAIAGARELRKAADGEKTGLSNAAAILSSGGGDRLKKALTFENRPVQLSPASAASLYGKELNSSVSRIEQFKSCPYKHFIDYGLRPESVRALEEDSRMTGTYVHAMMDRLSKAMKKDEKTWDTVTEEELHTLTENAAKAMRESHNSGYFTTDKRAARIEERLKGEVEFAARSIKRQMEGCSARTVSTERRFGSNGELTVSGDDVSINIQGIVDRVDIAVAEDGSRFLRIVDYKTGAAASKYSMSEVFYGIRIQLIVYLMAALNIYKDCMPAGGFYFHINMPFTKYTEDERFMDMRMDGFLINDKEAVMLFDNTDTGTLVSMKKSLTKEGVRGGLTADDMELLMKYTKRLISQAVRDIFCGRNDINPYYEDDRTNACRICDYRSICRFDESYPANRRNYIQSKDIRDIEEAAQDGING